MNYTKWMFNVSKYINLVIFFSDLKPGWMNSVIAWQILLLKGNPTQLYQNGSIEYCLKICFACLIFIHGKCYLISLFKAVCCTGILWNFVALEIIGFLF